MKLTDISTIRQLFEKHGFSFTKSLGQNFLINPTVCPKIAEMGGAGKNVGAIEIGTGIGVLTRELAERCEKVVAIEIDTGLKPILDETLEEYDNVEVIFADVMETDLNRLIAEKFPDMDVIVCANLPYYITSPVIMKLLEEKLPIKAITVMVQLEAADRICAAVGSRECGAITASINYYAKPKKLFRVNRGSFMPAPNVRIGSLAKAAAVMAMMGTAAAPGRLSARAGFALFHGPRQASLCRTHCQTGRFLPFPACPYTL